MFDYRIKDCVEPLKSIYPWLQNIKDPIILSKPLLGSIFWYDLGRPNGPVQGGIRPCIIFNNFEQCTVDTSVVIPLTSSLKRLDLPVHAVIKSGRLSGLQKDSMALCEQLLTAKNDLLYNPLGILTYNEFCNVYNTMKAETPLLTGNCEKSKELKKYFDVTIPVIEKIRGIR